MRSSLGAAGLLVLVAAAPATAGDEDGVAWSTSLDGTGDVRTAAFVVADAGCGYRTMADPMLMAQALDHLEGVLVHRDDGHFQDLTLTERFFPIGVVHSRYLRVVDGAATLEWKLIEGRQARHDGHWTVTRRADGRGEVDFVNVIEAKSSLHQPLLRGIQIRTMGAVVDSVQRTCAAAM